ncbi:MAG TPA: IPT/TIG domain-containing protein [Actinoplanes sp.]|nr:IPT/TIG domain-containing protein [Actinoplanes sp.]
MQRTSRVWGVSAALVLGAASVPFVASPALAAAPVITSFTPAIAGVDDTITVTGTGLAQLNPVVKVNGLTATVSGTPTATSLTFKVPPDTGGGKVSLTNAGGTGTSAGDLFITPPFSTVADISGTGRTTLTTKNSLTVPAGKRALRVWDAQAGDRVSVVIENPLPSGCTYEIGVYDANMINLGTADCRRSNTGWLETLTATTVAGTQTLVVNNLSSSSGTVDVTVAKIPADVNLGTLPLDGTTNSYSISNAGQNGYLSFTTVAPNQKMSVKVSDASTTIFGCCGLRWGLYKADGTKIGSSVGNASLSNLSLATAGTYQLRFDPLEMRSGSFKVSASLTPTDANLGVLTVDGIAKTVSIGISGQNGTLTITTAAAQTIAVQTSAVAGSLNGTDLKWGVYGPAPSTTRIKGTAGEAFLDAVKLPKAGTYEVRFDPSGTSTGAFTVTAFPVSDVDAGTLALNGTVKPVTISAAGQNAYLSFAGTEGQRIALQTSGVDTTVFGCCKLSWGLFNASGRRLGGATGNGYLNPVTLPAAGTYQVRIDPAGNLTGSVNVAAWDVPPDVNLGGLAGNGSSTMATISNPGQNGYLTYVNGTVGQKVTFKATRASAAFGCCYVQWTLKNPAGTAVKRWAGNASGTVTLSQSGTYRIYVDPVGPRVGSITFTANPVS